MQAIGGLLFLNMVAALAAEPDGRGAPGILHREWNAAIQAALTGFETAFDHDLVREDLQGTLDLALDRVSQVAEAAWADLPEKDRLGDVALTMRAHHGRS